MSGSFFNPYVFVPPWPQRRDVPQLKDGSPQRLGRLHNQHWSGRLRVRITGVTPLLISEQSRDANRLTQRATRTINGEVLLASSSVKGSIRAEYEAVTGSRYGVFEGHDRKMGYRSSGGDSGDLVPARIIIRNDEKVALLLDGMKPEKDWPPGRLLKAAWVPRYGPRALSSWPPEVVHGTKCHAWAVLMCREKLDKRTQKWRPDFWYWRVVALWADGHAMIDKPAIKIEKSDNRRSLRRHRIERSEPIRITGFYMHTNRNIGNKYNERLFFHPQLATKGEAAVPSLVLDDKVIEYWRDLIDSYHRAHNEEEIHKRQREDGTMAAPSEFLNAEKPAWSWHLAAKGADLECLKKLPDGTLCYARLSKEGDQVVGLYPVALSRMLDDVAPAELAAAANLTPARAHGMLSPADRVFGWVPPAGRADAGRANTKALRGRVRFGPVRTISAKVERIDLGLAVLGAPRPAYDLFYAASEISGTPLRTEPGKPCRYGYRPGQGLRGRKLYPHQPDIDWTSRIDQQWLRYGTGLSPGTTDPAVDSQNARLVDWIREDAIFEIDLYIEDLDTIELGALLYVLRGPRRRGRRYHKLGGGAPLGFGSVTYEVLTEQSELADGAAWKAFFALDKGAHGAVAPTVDQLDKICDAFISKVAPNGSLPPHLVAYEKALEGFPTGIPVHYPADPDDPCSSENRYKWFGANKSSRWGLQETLGPLESGEWRDVELSTDPTAKRKGSFEVRKRR